MKNLINSVLIFTLSLFLILFPSCKGKQKYRGHIISRSKMIRFLVDLHKTDAILKIYDFSDKSLSNYDSASYYNYLLRKYKINYADFERSFKYYFSDIEDFKQMYEIILDSIRKRMDYLDSMQQLKMKKKNLWPGKQYYLIPFHDYAEDSIPFRINNPKPGVYVLTYEVALYEDDQTYDIRGVMKVKYENGLIDSVFAPIYLKDNRFHNIKLILKLRDTLKPVALYGNLMTYSKTIYMHAKIRNIELYRYNYDEPVNF